MVYDSSGNSVTCNYDLGRSVIDEEKRSVFRRRNPLCGMCTVSCDESDAVCTGKGNQVIEVQEGDFYNRVRIEDGKAYMEEADCPDGYCEEQGKINNRSQTIVCLPHKLVVEIEEVENSDDSQNEKEIKNLRTWQCLLRWQ